MYEMCFINKLLKPLCLALKLNAFELKEKKFYKTPKTYLQTYLQTDIHLFSSTADRNIGNPHLHLCL